MVCSGAVCLLIETLWSDPDFFLKRTQVDYIQNSIEETINIRKRHGLSFTGGRGCWPVRLARRS